MTNSTNRYEGASLFLSIMDAIESGEAERDPTTHAERLRRFEALVAAGWAFTTQQFPELQGFQTLPEGIEATAQRLDLPLPLIDYHGYDLLGSPRGFFAYAEEHRVIEVWTYPGPSHPPYYGVHVLESAERYQEQAPTLEEVTRVVSEWSILHLSVAQLAQKHSWIRAIPVEVTWHMRLE